MAGDEIEKTPQFDLQLLLARTRNVKSYSAEAGVAESAQRRKQAADAIAARQSKFGQKGMLMMTPSPISRLLPKRLQLAHRDGHHHVDVFSPYLSIASLIAERMALACPTIPKLTG